MIYSTLDIRRAKWYHGDTEYNNKCGGDGMKLTVKTVANGTIERDVANSREAVNVLRALAAEGIKCVRWWCENVD